MHGIDIADWQAGIDVSAVPSDFVIVKATGGTGFINKYFNSMADKALSSGRKLGIYHYARESSCPGSPQDEAAHYLSIVQGYKGLFVPALDWEADAQALPIAWAREWLETVERALGATPIFYAGAGYVNSTNCDKIKRYPLWKASYLNRYQGVGYVENPYDSWGSGSWDRTTIYQYTSTGRLPNWDNNLDLNYCYGDGRSWDALCGKRPEQVPGDPVNDAGLKYRVHVENLGWLKPARDGQTAGTVGFGLRAEAIEFLGIPKGWKLRVHAHMEGIGWKTFDVEEGTVVGTIGEARRLEMLQVEVVERPKGDKRRLQFKVHEQDTGWKADTPEGFASGSDGQARRLEAFRFWID